MVYKTNKLSEQSLWKMTLRYTIVIWVLIVAFYYLVQLADQSMHEVEMEPWVLAVISIPALAIAVLGMRRLKKFRSQWENLFFTLTESGLMYESEREGLSLFVPWCEISMVRRSGNIVNLYMKNGRSLPCIMEGICEPRQREFFQFAIAHAGKVSDAALVPPPADAQVEQPLRYSATMVQRKEVADAMALVDGSARVQWLRPAVLLVWIILFTKACYDVRLGMMGISFVLMLSSAYSLWRPGHRMVRFNQGGADIHVKGEGYLIVKDGGIWSYVRSATVKGATRLKYCDFYLFSNGGNVAIDHGQPQPEGYPEPCGKLPRRLTGWPLVLVLVAAMAVGVLAFTQSRLFHLHQAINSAEPLPHLEALVGCKCEEGMSMDIGHHFKDKFWLTRANKRNPFAALIVVSFPDGSEKDVHLDDKGRVLYTERTKHVGDSILYLDDDGNIIAEDIYATEETN